MIAFEAEVPLFLLVGFTVVAILSFIALLVLFIRSHNLNLLFFVVITVPDNHPMLTEECSLRVGLAGVCWACSMLFMFIGIFRIVRKNKDNAV